MNHGKNTSRVYTEVQKKWQKVMSIEPVLLLASPILVAEEENKSSCFGFAAPLTHTVLSISYLSTYPNWILVQHVLQTEERETGTTASSAV